MQSVEEADEWRHWRVYWWPMLPQKIFKNHKIFEKKSQDLDSKSQVLYNQTFTDFYCQIEVCHHIWINSYDFWTTYTL